MQKLILKSFQSPGDIVMLTAAVRDLHRAAPDTYQTDVRTSAADLWENNPHITSLSEEDPSVEVIDMEYPLIHDSNSRPYHFIHGYTQFLEQKLGRSIPLTEFRGDIYLSEEEKSTMELQRLGIEGDFWILMAGGKYDFTAKWWNPTSYQRIVDHFDGRIQFVQCGDSSHWHPALNNVINLVGQTSLREFVKLMYHADGVVCPITFAMHLSAAVETKSSKPRSRACVVVAGGREPPQWEAYPHHQFISTNGALDCCDQGGCWKSRCQLVGDGDEKDQVNVCTKPIDIDKELRIPKCMEMISAEDVIRRIEIYYQGQALRFSGKTSYQYAASTLNSFNTPKTKERQLGTIKELRSQIYRHRRAGESIVFTNGCFDLLHAGHISLLQQAATKGDILVVGLNSDSSVKTLKGAERPINSEQSRAEMLLGIKGVDYVVIFDQETPAHVICTVRPDVLVKGEDYRGKEVVGREFVEANGGRVELVEFKEGFSTTTTIQGIQDKNESIATGDVKPIVAQSPIKRTQQASLRRTAVRDKPLHNFLFEFDKDSFFNELDVFATPWIDVCVLLQLARHYQPQTFLEIGTHRGYTTRILADKFPEMKIVSVDPGDQIPAAQRPPNQQGEFLTQDKIGELVDDYSNVTVVKEPFLDIEWDGQTFEMIFIDGNHNLPHVLEDSHRALEIVTQPGVIVWHDYNNVPDVNTALDQLDVSHPIVNLHNTWTAYLDTH